MSLALAQIALVAASAFSARAVYVFAQGAGVLIRLEESPPDADVQPFLWHLVCRDFTWISNIARPLDEQ